MHYEPGEDLQLNQSAEWWLGRSVSELPYVRADDRSYVHASLDYPFALTEGDAVRHGVSDGCVKSEPGERTCFPGSPKGSGL